MATHIFIFRVSSHTSYRLTGEYQLFGVLVQYS